MKKKRITYGVAGMMEYQAVIKIGRLTMKVLFTDGSANAMGMNPATYSTENLIVQQAIESSDQFKRGLIKVVGVVELDEDVQIMHNRNEENREGLSGSHLEAGENEAEEKADENRRGETAGHGTLTEMEFDNNDDAKDYLEQAFGCVRSRLRNREDIKAAGEANGVKIIFV